MPLKPCRECGKQVSTEAVSCPDCGVPRPTEHPKPAPPAQTSPPNRLPTYPRRQTARKEPDGGFARFLAAVVTIVVLFIVGAMAMSNRSDAADRERADDERRTRLSAAEIANRASADSLMLAHPQDSLATLEDSTLLRIWRVVSTYSYDTTAVARAWKDEARRLGAIAGQKRRDRELIERRETERLMAESRIQRLKRGADCGAPSEAKLRRHVARSWSDDALRAIACGSVYIGMSADQVVAAWGRPRDINRTTYSFGVHEQWVYNNSSYVYFENGIVTAIQN